MKKNIEITKKCLNKDAFARYSSTDYEKLVGILYFNIFIEISFGKNKKYYFTQFMIF